MPFFQEFDFLFEFFDGLIGGDVGEIIVFDFFNELFFSLFEGRQMIGQVMHMIF